MILICPLDPPDIIIEAIKDTAGGMPNISRYETAFCVCLHKQKKKDKATQCPNFWSSRDCKYQDGVRIQLCETGRQSIDLYSAIEHMLITIMAAFGEMERNLISERTRMAM